MSRILQPQADQRAERRRVVLDAMILTLVAAVLGAWSIVHAHKQDARLAAQAECADATVAAQGLDPAEEHGGPRWHAAFLGDCADRGMP